MLIVLAVAFLAHFSEAFDFFQNDYVVEFVRVDLDSYSKEAFDDLKVVTWKYNRTQPVVNTTFALKVDLENRVEVVVQAYKFLSNEYREFPMRFQFNACKGFKSNMFGMSRFYQLGNFPKCPIKKGHYHISKWAPDPSKFPPQFPSGQYMATFEAVDNNKIIFTIKAYAEFKRPITIPN